MSVSDAVIEEARALNWLITGGCGFIGRVLVADLIARGVPAGRIRVFDNLSVGSSDDLAMVARIRRASSWSDTDDGVGLFEGDIRNSKETLSAVTGADIVVHLAACTGVQPSVENPRLDCDTNVMGTLNCLEAARHGGARRFIFASSGAPLGIVEPPIHEELVARPISPYGASKLSGEAYCSAYFHSFGLETVALRFGNVYGPLSTHKSSIVARFVRRAMQGEPLEIYGDGSATRDYIYVDDLTAAINRAAFVSGIGGEVFQIATSRETTVSEVTEQLLCALAKHGMTQVKVIHASPRPGDMPRNYSDTRKARQRLGWQAQVTLAEGLERTVAWFVGGESSQVLAAKARGIADARRP